MLSTLRRATPAALPPTITLTEQQIRFYREEGYLSVPRVTSDDDIAAIREMFEDLTARRAGYDEGNYFDFAANERDGMIRFPQMHHLSKYCPKIVQTQAYYNCFEMARQILGPKTLFVFDHGPSKPPGGPPSPWHQDQAFAQAGARRENITFWIALDDVDRSNGCMEFIPRSHLGPILPHRSPNNDPRIHAIEAIGVDERLAVACPLRAGGATLHGNKMLHYTRPNVSDRPRRALALMYGIKVDHVLVEKPFPWMVEKQTRQMERDWSGRDLLGKAKFIVKSGLQRVGIYYFGR